jgi:CDP-glycerol glycerophosphotransferase (TagB/SpsB family)
MLWEKDRVDEDFKRDMIRVFDAHPEMLFLVRPHPVNTARDFLEVRRPNVVFVDEVCCVSADIQLSRIMSAVDRVITTVSTIAVDAAVSEKTVIVYEAGQKRVYNHLQAVDFGDVVNLLRDSEFLADAERRTKLFRSIYADCVDDRFYSRFGEILAEPPTDTRLDAGTATSLSLAIETEARYIENVQIRQDRDGLAARLEGTAASLEQVQANAKEAAIAAADAERSARGHLQHKVEHIGSLERRITELERELSCLRSRVPRSGQNWWSRSTRPLRAIVSAARAFTTTPRV